MYGPRLIREIIFSQRNYQARGKMKKTKMDISNPSYSIPPKPKQVEFGLPKLFVMLLVFIPVGSYIAHQIATNWRGFREGEDHDLIEGYILSWD